MKHILIVDDSKTSLAAARSVLCDTYKVTAVTHGAQALRFLESNTCDLILLDINMPEINGFMVMEKIQADESHAHIPIIILTADNDADTENRCLENGAVDFIVKPFVPAVMRARIGRILEMEDMRRQLADKLESKIREVCDIRTQACSDIMTGLLNKAYTEKAVIDLLSSGERGYLLMIDIDDFKSVNDTYGHIEGDTLLRGLADILKKHASEGDIVGRIGGDEFLLFIRGGNKKMICAMADSVISDTKNLLRNKGITGNASLSVGIAQYPEDASDFASLYTAADKALYHVKQNGKNSFHLYSDQRAKENARGKELITLQYLNDIMVHSDTCGGSYRLDPDSFHHVYNFIRRFIAQSGRDAVTLLFTARSEDDPISPEKLGRAMDNMEQAMYMSLRRADVVSRYSSRQMVAIIMDADTERGTKAAQRIIECYDRMNDGCGVTFDFGMAQMEKPDIPTRV